MKTFLQGIAVLFGIVGFIQLLNAILGNGSGLLATLTLIGAVVAMTMSAVLDLLNRIASKS
jgi:hypothetical protein